MPRAVGQVRIGFARKVDSWVGLAACALLYEYARLRRQGLPRHRATTPPRDDRPRLAPKRILTIKTYGLGNMAILLPVLAALRREYPAAEIDMLTLDSNCDFIQRSGLIDRTIPLRLESLRTVAASLWSILRTTRSREYDLVIDFEQFIKLSSIIAYLTGAPVRVGYNTDAQKRGWLYTTRVVYTDGEHMSMIFSRLLRPLDVDASLAPFEIPTRPEEDARIERFLTEAGIPAGPQPLVAVHVGSGTNFSDVPLKRWPPEYFARLADELITRHGAAVVFTGKGQEEEELIRTTMELMKQRAVNACDRFGIGELLSFLRRCTLTVSNDTSVMHLSAVMDTPVVALFGATSPQQYGPLNPERHLILYRDLYCSPCVTNYNLKVSHCEDAVCMRDITVEGVLEGIERKYLGATARRPSLNRTGNR